MYAGVVALIVKGCQDSGGLMKVFEIASESGRILPSGFLDPNPLQYFSLWIALFGGLSFWMSMYGLNQMAMQRYTVVWGSSLKVNFNFYKALPAIPGLQ